MRTKRFIATMLHLQSELELPGTDGHMHKTLIDCAALHTALNGSAPVVVDCRFDLANPNSGEEAFMKSHIPGARYVHLDRDLSAARTPQSGRHPLPAPAQLLELFSRLGIDGQKQVVAYDAAGGMLAAARFWWLLRFMGHDAVAVLDGGWQAWTAAGLPTTDKNPAPARANFSGQAHLERLTPLAQIAGHHGLIDSRDPARYRGEVEPIDPVAGHIPGARNHFCKINLEADGQHFRSQADLRSGFAACADLLQRGEGTFYCGSGVTACHNILAAVHAGFPEPRLYPGSWSEWCADRSRPVAVGAAP
jgi:thiosulfate/3-mercaptopyruvate sulfurtransferase